MSGPVVILVHSLEGGGAERVAVRLANELSTRGHEIVVLSLAHAQADVYPLASAVRRHTLDAARLSTNVRQALVNNLHRLWRLRAALRQLRPAAVVAFMSGPSVDLALARGSVRLAVGTERTHPPQMPLGWLRERLRAWAYGRLDAVVALTQESAQWLRTHTRARRVEVIANPVLWPMPAHEPLLAPASVLGPERRVLLAMGRLAPEKQLDHVLEAFAGLAAAHAQWDLVLLGEGPLRGALEAQRHTLGLDARVHLPGRVGNVGAWCERADLYVMSSRFEGFPNTLAEAMAGATAAVAYDCDTGPRDIIRHGVDGLLVPPGDRAALREALHSLMEDEPRRAAFARRATDVRQRFALDTIVDQWVQLLEATHGR